MNEKSGKCLIVAKGINQYIQKTYEILFGKMRDKPCTDLTGGYMWRQGGGSNAKILFA